MYLRAAHAVSNIPTLRQFIRENPLGVLTTALPSDTYPLLQASHIPWVFDFDDASETDLGRLRGHMARQNPHAKAMIDCLSSPKKQLATWFTWLPLSTASSAATGSGAALEQEVMILFTAPTNHYVTPKFYTETKPSTGKVVPTWNYMAVQAYGRATIHFDAAAEETVAFLSRQIRDLSDNAESNIMGYTGVDGNRPPWKVDDAPPAFVDLLRKNIIGIDITIHRLEGKFKMSQEMGAGDRQGVIQGFADLGSDVSAAMAKIVKERGELKDRGR